MKKYTQKKSSDAIRRILFISYSYWPPDFGGELRICIERFHSLAQRGYQIHTLTAGKPGCPSNDKYGRLTIHRSPVVGISRFARILRRIVYSVFVLFVLVTRKYDKVHFGSLNVLGANFEGLLGYIFTLVIKIRRKESIWVHSLSDTEEQAIIFNGLSGKFRFLYLKNVTHIIGVSPMLHKGLIKFFPQSKLIPYGIRNDIFYPLTSFDRTNFRKEHGSISENEVIFTFMGTLSKRKGFDQLAEVFASEAKKNPNWRLWVIGPRNRVENQNIDETEVKELTSTLLPCSNQVKYWGRIDSREELALILGSSDIFVFPTLREGMPISPMEAMASGLPVIISYIKGVTDLANIDGETGLFIQPNNISDLNNALLKIGTDANKRRLMGVKASERIRQNFDWEQYIEKWHEIYS